MKRIISAVLALCLVVPCFFALSTGTVAYDSATVKNIKRIVFDDVTVFEGSSTEIRSGIDPATGETYEFEAYAYYPEGVTVYYKNGQSDYWITDGNIIITEDGEYSITLADDQSPDNVWGVGKHTGYLELLGFTGEITVTVKESPIERIEARDVFVTETANLREFNETDENGKDISYMKYDYNPDITVFFKDGTSEECSFGIIIDEIYCPSILSDSQSPENLWGVGEHEATVSLLGAEARFTVTVLENPIESIEVSDFTVYENFDGLLYEYTDENGEVTFSEFSYNFSPDKVKVKFKNGTSCIATDGYITYLGKPYFIAFDKAPANEDDMLSYNEPWNVGETRRFSASVMGVRAYYNVTVAESPYVGITVSEGDEFVLTLLRSDGGKEEYKAASLSFAGYMDASALCLFRATNGKRFYMLLTLQEFSEESHAPDFTKSFSATVGLLKSNTVNGNRWVKTADDLSPYGTVLGILIKSIRNELGYNFTEFDGTVTDENLDALIIIADYIFGESGEIVPADDGSCYYAKVSTAEVERSLYEAFGIKGVDLGKSSFCRDGALMFPIISGALPGIYRQTLEIRDPLISLTYTEIGFGDVGITFDSEYHIKKLTFEKERKKGDIDGNDKVTSFDSYLIKKIAVGIIAPDTKQRAAADINGDGKVNAGDTYLIKRIILGTYNA